MHMVESKKGAYGIMKEILMMHIVVMCLHSSGNG